jgi:sugar lactone lactonase YvrE
MTDTGPTRGNTLFGPLAALDMSVTPNRIYLTDEVHSRVLGWKSIEGMVNGQNADIVLGQPNFTSNTCNNGKAQGDVNGIGPDSLCLPIGLTVDSLGNLYVTDTGNSRALIYKTPFATCNSFPCVGPAAAAVIGQLDFFHGACSPTTASATSLCFPQGAGMDASDNLYVADSFNNRVLEYNKPFANPAAPNVTANLVFGQGTTGTGSELTTFACDDGQAETSENSLCFPVSASVDRQGNLYVADFQDCRVLEYDAPLATPATPNVTADVVWGQGGDFTGNCDQFGPIPGPVPGGGQRAAVQRPPIFAINATTLALPTDARTDVLGNLYIADGGDNRVLEFNTPLVHPFAPNLTADKVYGQGPTSNNFSLFTPDVTASRMNFPAGVLLDSANRLWVSDLDNNRVLRFPQDIPTPTASATPTTSATATATATASVTATPTRTASPTPTTSVTATRTASATPTASVTPTPTATATPTVTQTPTATPTATPGASKKLPVVAPTGIRTMPATVKTPQAAATPKKKG